MKVRWYAFVIVALVCLSLSAVGALAQTTPPTKVEPSGAKPPAGSGLGTAAALKNPKCNADAVDGYGTFSQITENGGPFCVAPAPKDNGGATARGVTAHSIKVTVVLANEEQLAADTAAGVPPAKNQATGGAGTIKDSILDSWAALQHTYENWGREVEFTFVTSSGSDEAAQRADAVAVEQGKPMFVIDTTSTGLGTLASVLGKDKYVVYSYATTNEDALKQAPYRWAQGDPNATATNAAEFVGKQLAKRKAAYAGDESMHSKTRTFGVVAPSQLDVGLFVASLKKQGVTLAAPPLAFTANGSPLGDKTTAQAEAPTLVGKLKGAGVTSVIMFTDVAMTGALTKLATLQEYRPEWIMTGYSYQDLTLLGRASYDQDQWAHAFGLSSLWPLVRGGNVNTSLITWYWGPNQGTVSIQQQTRAEWLAAAIQYAGPNLTPKNVQRGFFAIPARGGAASDSPAGALSGYGRAAGLPYDSYAPIGKDFGAVFYDSATKGESQVFPTTGDGVLWYLNEGKRYTAGTWPKRPFSFFEKSGAVFAFDTSPVPSSPGVPCTGCPSSGGPGTPAASEA